ncbi:MAG: ABC transporter ATP-binding protein [Bacteroidales bacterium]|nr:ABC transporter ATP-binding protein [Bacteroidales bacterium]
MLTIKNLSVSYGNQDVIKNLDLEIKPGECHGIAGLNGAGKTTLFNAIYGSVNKTSGEILLFNENIGKSNITFLETQQFFYSRITGNEYLKIFQIRNKKFDIPAWNKIFNLPVNKLIENYSTGMKKKLGLMGILSMDNPVFLFDEPFNGLDLETNRIVKRILENLAHRQKIILISSHIMESLTGLCDKISYLNNGKIEFTTDKTGFKEIENRIFKGLNEEQLDLPFSK